MIDPLEPHYSPERLAKAWAMSRDFIRRRFRYEPGILKFGSNWRYPHSLVQRIYAESRPMTYVKPLAGMRQHVRLNRCGRKYKPRPQAPAVRPPAPVRLPRIFTIEDQYISPKDLAKQWSVSADFIRRRFRKEPDLLIIGRSHRIPLKIVARVYVVAMQDGSIRPADLDATPS